MKRSCGNLRADYDAGDGSVHLTQEFCDMSPLFLADVLRDWIYELSLLYEQAIVQGLRGAKEATPASATKPLDTSS